jgi:DNA invertase Pin-like site-specific DNA recombinase
MAAFQAVGGLHPEEHSHIIVRRPELDHLLAHVQNGDLYVALSSRRQTGKTTLLYQLQARLHGHGYGVVYLDLSGLNDLSKAQFYRL